MKALKSSLPVKASQDVSDSDDVTELLEVGTTTTRMCIRSDVCCLMWHPVFAVYLRRRQISDVSLMLVGRGVGVKMGLVCPSPPATPPPPPM